LASIIVTPGVQFSRRLLYFTGPAAALPKYGALLTFGLHPALMLGDPRLSVGLPWRMG